jgi:hypothetical protein
VRGRITAHSAGVSLHGASKFLYRGMAFANIVPLRAQGEQRCGRKALTGIVEGLSHASNTIAVPIEFTTGLMCECP